uniref:Uncharacterized protein n=1 Tax=Wuchereria bancrofti TaxID=6293 RepID=A0A1I8ET14_WUCBA
MLLWRIILEDIASQMKQQNVLHSITILTSMSNEKDKENTILKMLQNDKNYRIEVQDVAPLTDTLLIIIIRSLAVVEEIIHLWNFIFLSHAAAHTYITYDHTDHFHWLQQELLQEECKFDLLKDTDLKDYGNMFGKNRVVEVWTKERPVIKLRQMFNDNQNNEYSADSKCPTTVCKKGVLDLVRCLEQLAVVVQNAPDASFSEVVNMRIWGQAVVALLTNQFDELFRDHVFNLLKYILLGFLLKYNSNVYSKKIIKRKFDFKKLLSSQRKGCPITDEIASSLFSLLFEQPILFSDKLGLDHIPFLKVNHASHRRQYLFYGKKAFAIQTCIRTEYFIHVDNIYYQNILSVTQQKRNADASSDKFSLCTTAVFILRRVASLPRISIFTFKNHFLNNRFDLRKRNNSVYGMSVWYRENYMLCIKQFTSVQYVSRDAVVAGNGSPECKHSIKKNHSSRSYLCLWRMVDNAAGTLPKSIKPLYNAYPIVFFPDKFFYRNSYSKCLPPIDEYAERLIFCVTEISQFFTSVPVKSLKAVTNQEIKLFKIFLSFLSLNYTRIVTFEHRNNKQRLMNICGERIGYLFSPLIAFVLSPPSTKASKLSFTTSNTGRNVGEQLEMKKRLMIVKTLVSKNNHLKSLLDHLKANLISFEIFLKYLNISY